MVKVPILVEGTEEAGAFSPNSGKMLEYKDCARKMARGFLADYEQKYNYYLSRILRREFFGEGNTPGHTPPRQLYPAS